MELWEEKQEAVGGLFEVKDGEPVLGKLPEIGNLVESGLKDDLIMVLSSMKCVAKEKRTSVADDESTEEEADVQAEAEEGSNEGCSCWK